VHLGFHALKADTSLLYYSKGSTTIFLPVYVDDIIITSSSQEAVAALLEDLRANFALKDLGPLHHFFGRDRDTIHRTCVFASDGICGSRSAF
jgi:hypothetical protein